MAYDLKFQFQQQGISELEKIPKLIAELGKTSVASNASLQQFEGILRSDAKAGIALNETLRGLASLGKTTAPELTALAKAAQGLTQAKQGLTLAAKETTKAFGGIHLTATSLRSPMGALQTVIAQTANSMTAMEMAATGMGAALVMGAGFALKASFGLGEYAREQINIASRTGLTTTQTQLFGRSAELAGVNAGALTTSMRTLTRALAENSDEGKKGKAALREIGLDASVAFQPMGEILPQIFQKLSLVNSAIERDRILITLFGRGGLELAPLIDHFAQLEQQVTASGVVIDKEGITKAAAYQRQVALLGLEWDSLKNKIGAAAMGVIDFAHNYVELIKATSSPAWGPFAPSAAPPPAIQSNVPDPMALIRQEHSEQLRRYNESIGTPEEKIKAKLSDLAQDRSTAEAQRRDVLDPQKYDVELRRIDALIKGYNQQLVAIKALEAGRKALSQDERAVERLRLSASPVAQAIFDANKTTQDAPASLRQQFGAVGIERTKMAAQAESKRLNEVDTAEAQKHVQELVKLFEFNLHAAIKTKMTLGILLKRCR